MAEEGRSKQLAEMDQICLIRSVYYIHGVVVTFPVSNGSYV